MYGAGMYFAESTGKADEYSRPREGMYCMILARVALGRTAYVADKSPDALSLSRLCGEGTFDSVLGDRQAAVGTYREFIVYNEDAAYPSYVICYKRVVIGETTV